MMSLTEFNSELAVNITEVPILGKVGMGHKPAGGKGTWSGTAHYNQSVLRRMAGSSIRRPASCRTSRSR
ncbi:MAG: phage tail tube protein [Evtepia sp.]